MTFTMKRQFLITIFFLLVIAGRLTGQCTVTLSGANIQTVCINAAITSFSYATTGITGAAVAGLPAGVTGAWSSPNFTISGTPTESGVFNFTVTFTGDGGCSATGTITVNPLPFAAGSVTGSAAVCQGQNDVSFTVPAIGGATEYIWSYSGTGATFSGNTNPVLVDFSPTATGGDITVSGRNTCGDGTVSTGFTVTVNPLAGAAGAITGSGTVCQGQSGVSYSVGTIAGASGYTWTYSGTGAGISGSGENITIDFSASATGGNLTVKGTNSCGEGTSSSLAITVNPLPSAAGSVTGTATVCQGQNDLSFSVPAIGGATEYIWSYGGTGATFSGNTNPVLVDFGNAATGGDITVSGRNICGDGTTSSGFTVTVNLLPVAAGAITGSGTVCQGQSGVSYNVGTITNASGYSWTYDGTGASISGSGENITIDFSSSATGGNLTVKGTNSCGEGTSSSLAITVNPLPAAAGVITGDNLVCSGETGISYNISSISNATGYDWTLPTGALIASGSNTEAITVNFGSVSGNVTVTGTNLCGNGTSASLPVTVNPVPTLSTVTQPTDACNNSITTIHLTGLLANTEMVISFEINGTAQTPATVTSNGSGDADLSTRILTRSGDDGETLEVTSITVTGTSCSRTFSGKTTTLAVDQLPTMSGVTQTGDPVCPGTGATFQISGLIASTTSTIYYTVDYGPEQPIAGVVSNSSGRATFTSVNLLAENNGKRLHITRIRNTGWESGCLSTFGSTYYGTMEVTNVNPLVTGPSNACANVAGNVYSTSLSATSYTWHITGGTINSGQGTSSVSVTWTASGNIYVECVKDGCTGSSASYPVSVNPVPASSITGDNIVYMNSPTVYSTTAGMLNYQWQVVGGSPATGDGSSISVTWATNPTHEVRLRYTTPAGCTTSWTTLSVSVRPAVSNVHIDYLDGSPQIGGSGIRVDYTYTDGSTGSDASTYRWYRGATLLSTNRIYVPVDLDFNQVLSCQVTPVSTAGALSGTPGIAFSDPIEDLRHPEIVPLADQICIDGLRSAGSKLKGKYRYTYPYKPEGVSTYNWVRRDSTDGTEVPLGNGIEYTLVDEDLKANQEIYFEVTPRSSNYVPVSGTAKRSKPMARIIGLDDRYGISEPPVTLRSNVTGGYFSGPGVYENVFIPDSAGEGDWEINQFKFYEYSSYTCSQRSPQNVRVDRVDAVFSPINSRYCFTDPKFVVTVNNIPAGAYNKSFFLSDPNGIIWAETTPTSVTIDPGRMGAGTKTLYYSYNVDVVIMLPLGLPRIIRLYFKIDKDFYLDKVSQEIKLLGLAPSYCENDGEKYVNVENVYPLGGSGHWTGSILKSPQDVVSAYVDPALGTAGTEYTITYQYESTLGCFSPILTQKVKINHLPETGFSVDPTYNIEGPEDKLIPVQPGGIFSGKGISGNLFLPAVAGEGTHTITYTIRDGNNCIDSLKHTTEVRAARGTITGINDIVCYDNVILNLSVTGLPASGVVVPSGYSNTRNTLVTVPGVTTAVYSVPAAGEGADTIYFSYKWDGLDYAIYKTVNIDSLGTAIIYNLQQDQMVCDDVPPFELTVSKPGGIFTGPVVGGYFDASKATTADTVKYTFTNSKTGCSIDTSYNVRVYKAPKVDFIPYDVCIEHDKDTLRFMNKTTTADPVVRWEWKFYNGASYPDSVASAMEAGFPYLTGGLKKVALLAETDKGCFVEKEKTFDIGRRPEADFYWKKDCYHPSENQVLDQLQLFDATSYTTQPKSWSWRMNGTEFGTSNNAVHLKSDTGIMRIEYIVRTDYYLCHDTAIRDIYIRPAINITADGYFEDFETGKRGWMIGDTSAIWSFGKPDGTLIKSAASGQHAWFTANASDGSSMVESPCFDLREMQRPVIKLHVRKDFDKDRDGAVLQYRLGDSPDWHSVGTIDDGIEWYNSATINGKPGGNSLGWTTAGASDDDYKEAIHILDELKGKKDVRFRLIYGSAGSYSDHDGMSFDDIFIGERSRQVLVEHFTSYNSTESMNFKAIVDTIAEHKEGDVINIQYHTNLSGTDSLYIHNPGEINARILFYGLTRVPYTFVDGGTNANFNMLYDYRSARIDSNTITKRSLVNSGFRLSLNPVVAGRVLTVKGYIKAVENASISNLTLFIAVTEKSNPGDFTGVPKNIEFLNVFRKFIPDASGTLLKTNWIAGDSISLPEKTWTIEKVLNSSDIEIIAFLQSADNKEVYQAFSVIKPDIMVGIENPLGKEARFSIWPNPASNIVTIGFNRPVNSESLIRIYNIQGEIVREYRAGAGSSKFTIEDPGLKGGIYLVRVSTGNLDIGYKKLIITED